MKFWVKISNPIFPIHLSIHYLIEPMALIPLEPFADCLKDLYPMGDRHQHVDISSQIIRDNLHHRMLWLVHGPAAAEISKSGFLAVQMCTLSIFLALDFVYHTRIAITKHILRNSHTIRGNFEHSNILIVSPSQTFKSHGSHDDELLRLGEVDRWPVRKYVLRLESNKTNT